jgi:predicted dehydrogenase
MSEPTSFGRKAKAPSAAAKATRIGLIGCGRWGALILRDLSALGCAVTVAAHNEESRQRALAGGAIVVGEPEELPEDLAGYVVATPTATHGEIVLRLLPRERPLFVEKPLTADLASARRIAELGRDRVFVMEKWRYHPGIEALGGLARSGALGSPVKLVTSRLQWGHDHADVDPVWTLLPHDLGIAREILGRLPTPRLSVAERAADGTVTGMLAVLGDSVALQCEVSSRRPRHFRSVELICRDGAAALDGGYADHIRLVRRDGDSTSHALPEERRPIATDMPLYRELAAFVGFCNGGPAPKSTAADGLAAVETILALRKLAGIAE